MLIGLKFSRCKHPQRGFTLTELLIVVVISGIIAALGAPTWFQFLEDRRLVAAQDKIHLGIRQAQAKAQQNATTWRFGIRQINGDIEWAVYPNGAAVSSIAWHPFNPYIQIDDETSLRRSSVGIYSVKFDHRGNARILGRITLSNKSGSKAKRCVIVSTLLGETRKAKARSTPDPTYRRRERYCY
ncbi:MAG: prepilin-type N-terminal cleavage/methylation domain-containing protein [Cyanobacteria bacterium P01_D01_bin.44]